MVVGQVDTQFTGEAGVVTRTRGHDTPRAGALHGDADVFLCIQYIDLTDRDRAIMAGQAELGAATGCGCNVVGIDRAGGVGGVGCPGKFAVP